MTEARPRLVLTTREYALLEYLARHAGEVVGRADIAEHVWDESYDPLSNVIDVYIQRLRRKIDEPGAPIADSHASRRRLRAGRRADAQVTLRMRLSIRARLTLWYSAVLFAVLIVRRRRASVAASTRSEVRASTRSCARARANGATACIRNEIGERLTLPRPLRRHARGARSARRSASPC